MCIRDRYRTRACDRIYVILTTGGLGPTYGDSTRESAAEQMGVPLVRDPETERRIREYFTATGRELTDNNWRQAMIPEGGEALVNLNGTAPGIWLEKDGKILVQLPGPPRECLPIFREPVLPRLRERTGQNRVTRDVYKRQFLWFIRSKKLPLAGENSSLIQPGSDRDCPAVRLG